MKNSLFSIIISSLAIVSLVSCNNPAPESTTTSEYINQKDISVIYTSDVHCGLDDKLGYASLAAYKKNLAKTNEVLLVDSGDFLQGDFVGAISEGEYVIEVMNKVKYDIVTLGNHEFDYGISTMAKRLKELDSDIVCSNVKYTGKKENKIDFLKSYFIKDYGYKKIGFIGLTTPFTLMDSDPTHFIEDGETVYDFGSSSPEHFYKLVQDNIDECKGNGADYVVVLSHLGSLDNYKPYSSRDVIANTSGVTAFLDGHAHVDLPFEEVLNKKNEKTLLVDTGYKMDVFASLTFKKDGSISHEYVTEYEEKDAEVASFVQEINAKADEKGDKVLANIDLDLKITDDDGIRMIRNREMPIGDLVADGYREISGSNISFVNGGGIRNNLNKGDVTYRDIMNVHPFGNELLVKKTTGAKILDYLEFVCMNTSMERVKDGKPYGESGAFAQVSGIKYQIDTSIPTSVVTTEAGEFIRVDGERRIKNVKVLENDTFVDIDPNKEYTISSHNFLLNNGGDGANMFMNDPVVPAPVMLDYEIVIKYIVDVLKGHLSEKYATSAGRIEVI